MGRFHRRHRRLFHLRVQHLVADRITADVALAARLLPDGRFLLFTSIGMPQKAFNIRRDPKVSLLFSNPTGSGVANPGAVLIQGDATAEDRIVTDMTADPELAAHLETICARQPASSFMSSWLGRRMLWSYYIRILVYVAPRRVFHWPDLDFTRAPAELDLSEVRGDG
jgi:hypothetical protein